MKNNGIQILNQNKSAKKTIVVMGVARSGTTMTAKVLHALGVDMGYTKDNLVGERKDVSAKLENGKLKEFVEIVQNQNKEKLVWGWKRPRAYQYTHLFESRIRNPHYIVPFRDYVAIANRNSINVSEDFSSNLVDTHRKKYNKLIDFIEQNKKPILLFSYEKAITDKEYYVKKVAEFVGIEDEKKIAKAILEIEPNNKKYIANSNILLGRIGVVKNKRLRGWAQIKNSNKKLNLKLIINNKFQKNILANKSMPKKNKIGEHYFNVQLDFFDFKVGETYKIEVLNQNDKHLKNSPYSYLHQ